MFKFKDFIMILITAIILFIIISSFNYSGCACGSIDTNNCPCPNQDTLEYFKDNCKSYFEPSSAGSMLEMVNSCNKELNLSLEAFK